MGQHAAVVASKLSSEASRVKRKSGSAMINKVCTVVLRQVEETFAIPKDLMPRERLELGFNVLEYRKSRVQDHCSCMVCFEHLWPSARFTGLALS